MKWVLLCLLLSLSLAAAPGRSYYVNSDVSVGNDANPCTSQDKPCLTFERALPLVNPSDTLLASGTFVPLTALSIANTKTISSYPTGSFVAMECKGQNQLFTVQSSAVLSLSNVNVKNCAGYAIEAATKSAVSLETVTFTNAGVLHAEAEASISMNFVTASEFDGSLGGKQASNVVSLESGSSLAATNSEFLNNRGANKGGAISALGSASLSLTGVTMVNNSATLGGAIYAEGSSVEFENTVCDKNVASVSGGCAHFVQTPSVMFSLASFQGNSAGQGGGAAYFDRVKTVSWTSVTCKKNEAGTDGGCSVFVSVESVLMGNLTILSSNVAIQGNGGAFAARQSTLSLLNVVLDGNAANLGCGGSFYSQGGKLTASGLTLTSNTVAAIGMGAAGFMEEGVDFNLGIGEITGNLPSNEGCVCNASQGIATGLSLMADSIICTPSCDLSLNGDPDACSKQLPLAANARQSSVSSKSFSGVVGDAALLPIQLADPYGRPTAKGYDQLGIGLFKGAQAVFTTIKVAAGSTVGAYIVNMSLPEEGEFKVATTLSSIDIMNSPGSMTVSLPGKPATDLTALWVVLGLAAGAGLVVGSVFFYRRYFKRSQYLPIADGSSSTTAARGYGGVGFMSESEEV